MPKPQSAPNLNEYITQVGQARRTLDAHARALASSIGERRRKLKQFEDRLFDRVCESPEQAALPVDDITPDPDLHKLIAAPTAGL